MYYLYYIHYVIKLNKKIDFFEDLLPICITNKHMLSFCEKDELKICLYDYKNFYSCCNDEIKNLSVNFNEFNVKLNNAL